jgi:hypothetical protein
MNKRYLHHLWTRIRPIRTWYLLAALLLCVGIHILALRHNYVGMTKLRAAVYAADEQNGNVEAALQKLRAYMAAHMNTSLDTGTGVYPPIQLKSTYDRLLKAERDRVEAANATVYTEAQRTCEAKYPSSFSGGPRVPCIAQYVKEHGATAKAIPDAQYKFAFVSASWSPDLAGWTRVLSIVLLALVILLFTLGKWLQAAVK